MIVNPFAELPLAVFTTLMPAAGGSFLAIALAYFTIRPEGERLKALDRFTTIPLALLVVGFVGAFFHLAAPLHAYNALNGFGHSPLSNEICVTALFSAAVFVYWLVALAGKATDRFRQVMLVLLCMLAVLLVVFTGLAYWVDTIASWAVVWSPIEQVGYLLMATCVGAMVTGLAKIGLSDRFRTVVAVSVACGLVVSALATMAHFFAVAGMQGAFVTGANLVGAAVPYALVALLLGVAVVVCCAMAVRKENCHRLYAVASALLIVGVFCARLAFYCLQLGIGL